MKSFIIVTRYTKINKSILTFLQKKKLMIFDCCLVVLFPLISELLNSIAAEYLLFIILAFQKTFQIWFCLVRYLRESKDHFYLSLSKINRKQ